MVEKIIIGITGKKGAGKSTAADYLVHNYNFNEYAFATILKSVCMEIFKLKTTQLYGTQHEKESIDEYWNVSPRTIMQEVGSAIRDIGERIPALSQIWIRSTHREIEEHESLKKILISDLRYPDEADSIRAYAAKGWKVAIIKIERITDEYLDMHESETQEIAYDYLIKNEGTRKDLFDKLDNIIYEIFEN